MAYLSKEKCKEIRDNLKKEFPKFKFSVRNDNSTSCEVKILSGPVRFSDKDYESLNVFYPERYQNSDILTKMIAIINKGNYNNSRIEEDFFDVGWYYHISQGSWDKDYKVTE